MARTKAVATQIAMVVALLGFFAGSSLLAYKAAGAALNARSYVMPR